MLLFLLAAVFIVATAGMGVFASTVTKNQAQVGMMTLLVVVPMLLLSGIFTPLEEMPAWVRYLMALSPLRYFIDIATGILLKGIGLEILWPQALAMVALGGVLVRLLHVAIPEAVSMKGYIQTANHRRRTRSDEGRTTNGQ